jgi:hypothetical protein
MHAPRVGRATLALFAVVWLNMAAQPCLMALESGGDHEAGHAQMAPEGHGDDHCPHCPPTESPETGTDERCAFVSGFDYDARSYADDQSIKIKPPADAALPFDLLQSSPVVRLAGITGVDPPLPHSHSPPFLRFCRFIE